MKTLFAVLFLLAGMSGAWANDPDFVLINNTSRGFEGVYVSSEQDKDWNGNLVGNGIVLKPTEQLKMSFPKNCAEMVWDINVVDDAGLAVAFHKLDLKGAESVTLVEKDGKIEALVK